MRPTVIALLASTLLLGCTPAELRPVIPLVETEAPTLVSAQLPEDFYAQAEVAALGLITNYLATSDQITKDVGLNPDRMSRWVSPEWLDKELEGFRYYQETQERTVGDSAVDSAVVQLARITPEDTLDVGVMACVDTTAVLVMPPDTPDPPNEVLAWHPHYDDFDGSDQDWAVIEDFFATVPVRTGDRRAIVFWLIGDTLDTLVVDSSEEWWGINECSL